MNLQRIRGEALGRLKRKPKERWGVTTVLALLSHIEKVRDAALEEAAKECDKDCPPGWEKDANYDHSAEAEDLAQRIRAKKSKKAVAS